MQSMDNKAKVAGDCYQSKDVADTDILDFSILLADTGKNLDTQTEVLETIYKHISNSDCKNGQMKSKIQAYIDHGLVPALAGVATKLLDCFQDESEDYDFYHAALHFYHRTFGTFYLLSGSNLEEEDGNAEHSTGASAALAGEVIKQDALSCLTGFLGSKWGENDAYVVAMAFMGFLSAFAGNTGSTQDHHASDFVQHLVGETVFATFQNFVFHGLEPSKEDSSTVFCFGCVVLDFCFKLGRDDVTQPYLQKALQVCTVRAFCIL